MIECCFNQRLIVNCYWDNDDDDDGDDGGGSNNNSIINIM